MQDLPPDFLLSIYRGKPAISSFSNFLKSKISRLDPLCFIADVLRKGYLPSVHIADKKTRELKDYTPQHFLYFLPLPHGQGSLRPALGSVLRKG